MLCTQRPQWISAYDISVKVLVFPSILSNTPWFIPHWPHNLSPVSPPTIHFHLYKDIYHICMEIMHVYRLLESQPREFMDWRWPLSCMYKLWWARYLLIEYWKHWIWAGMCSKYQMAFPGLSTSESFIWGTALDLTTWLASGCTGNFRYPMPISMKKI